MTTFFYRELPMWLAEHKPLVLLLASALSLYALGKAVVSAASSEAPSDDEWRNDVFLVFILVMAYVAGFARDRDVERTSGTKATKAKKVVPYTKAMTHKVQQSTIEQVLRTPGAPAPDAAARSCLTSASAPFVPASAPASTSPITSSLAHESSSVSRSLLLASASAPFIPASAPPGNFEQLHLDVCILTQAKKNGVEHNAASYSKVMAACTRCDRDCSNISLQIIQQMLEKGVPSDCQSTPLYVRARFFKLVAEKLGDKTLRDNGLRFLEMIQAHGLMPTHMQQDRVLAWTVGPEVVKFLDSIKDQGASLSPTACRCLMIAHERTKPERALTLYDEILDRGIQLDQAMINAALCACSHLGKSSQALKIFSQMDQFKVPPNVKTYGAVIKACATTDKYREGLDLFDAMLMGGFEPNRFAYHDAILCCIKLDEVKFCMKALKLYKDMWQAGVFPSDPTYSKLITMCHTHGWTGAASEIKSDRLAANKWDKWSEN